jgi:hypothetical protein
VSDLINFSAICRVFMHASMSMKVNTKNVSDTPLSHHLSALPFIIFFSVFFLVLEVTLIYYTLSSFSTHARFHPPPSPDPPPPSANSYLCTCSPHTVAVHEGYTHHLHRHFCCYAANLNLYPPTLHLWIYTWCPLLMYGRASKSRIRASLFTTFGVFSIFQLL